MLAYGTIVITILIMMIAFCLVMVNIELLRYAICFVKDEKKPNPIGITIKLHEKVCGYKNCDFYDGIISWLVIMCFGGIIAFAWPFFALLLMSVSATYLARWVHRRMRFDN